MMRQPLRLLFLLAAVAGGFLTAVGAGSQEAPAEAPAEARPAELPPAIAAFRHQLWSAKPGGESFRLVIDDRMATDTARWVLAEHPELPFADPAVELYPGGLRGKAVAEVLGRRVRLEGLARLSLVEGVPALEIAELAIAGVEAPELLLDAVRGALEEAREKHFDFARIPLTLELLELEVGKATVAGTFRRLARDHLPAAGAAPPGAGEASSEPPPRR